jgi:membrane associated rhomboid family serine protease
MLLPIGRAEGRVRSASVIVFWLIVANIFMFLLELFAGNDFISGFSVVPFEITHGVDLVRDVFIRGAGAIPQAPGPTPIYLTLLTAMFMHSGWLHIGGNMLYLWIFGGEIEDAFGHLKFLFFYLICGLVGFFAQIWADPDSVIPSLGASGAIAGVMGAYLLLYPHNRIRTLLPLGWILIPIRMPALVVIGFWALIQYFSEVISITGRNAQTGGGIAYLAHLAGFVTGFVLALFLRRPPVHQNFQGADMRQASE